MITDWRAAINERKTKLGYSNRIIAIAAEINEIRLSRLLSGRETPKRRDTIYNTLLHVCSILGFSSFETWQILRNASRNILDRSDQPSSHEELEIRIGSYIAQRLLELLKDGESDVVKVLLRNYNFSSLVGESFRIYLKNIFLSERDYRNHIFEKLLSIAESTVRSIIKTQIIDKGDANVLQFCFHFLISSGGVSFISPMRKLLDDLRIGLWDFTSESKTSNPELNFIVRGERIAEELIGVGDPEYLPYLISRNNFFLKINILSQKTYLGSEIGSISELLSEISGLSSPQVSVYALATLSSRFILNPAKTIDNINALFSSDSYLPSKFVLIQKSLENNLRSNDYLSKQWKDFDPSLKKILELNVKRKT